MKKLIITSCLLLSSLIGYSQEQKTAPVKCQAITKSKEQCTRNAVTSSGHCKQHDPDAIRCAGKTKQDKPCGLIPKKGETLCHHHKINK